MVQATLGMQAKGSAKAWAHAHASAAKCVACWLTEQGLLHGVRLTPWLGFKLREASAARQVFGDGSNLGGQK